MQRFGRCNRYGECGETGADVFWVDLPDAAARPFTSGDFESARAILRNIFACGPSDLVNIPPSAPPRGAVIRRRDLLDLFDTDPDLSGFDVDVSLYVRDADDTDVRLFWRHVEKGGPPDDAPVREELCPAPVGGAKELLERKGVRAWRWDALTKQWRSTDAEEVFPGMTLWVDAKCGSYDAEKGSDPAARMPVEPIVVPSAAMEPAFGGDRDTTAGVRVSLRKHSTHAREQMEWLVQQLKLGDDFDCRLVEAAIWHDLGKAHKVFKARCGLAADAPPLAKTPAYNWRSTEGANREFFRHELASALGYLANRQWEEDVSLVAYLIAAHHGKVRMRLRALPKERCAEAGKLFARGIVDGDVLPETMLDGINVPETTLDLDIMQLGEGRYGPSWSART